MKNAQHAARFIRHSQDSDVLALHQTEGISRHHVRADAHRRFGHHRVQAAGLCQVPAADHQPPQVAVRDDAGQLLRRRNNQHCPKILAVQFGCCLSQADLLADQRHLVASEHDFPHLHFEPLTQTAAWMIAPEILGPEAATLEQSHSQGIAKGQCSRG